MGQAPWIKGRRASGAPFFDIKTGLEISVAVEGNRGAPFAPWRRDWQAARSWQECEALASRPTLPRQPTVPSGEANWSVGGLPVRRRPRAAAVAAPPLCRQSASSCLSIMRLDWCKPRTNSSKFAIHESLATWNSRFRFSFATLVARMRGLPSYRPAGRRPNPDRTSRPGISPASKRRWRRSFLD